MSKHRRPLNKSITIGCVMFIILLCVVLSIANFVLYRGYVYDDYQDYIKNILDYTLDHIDADDLKSCIESRTESEKFKETLLFMDDVMEHFEDIHYFYAVTPLNTEETGNVMSVFSAERYYDRYVDTEGNLYLGWISDDEYDAETATQLFEIMRGDEIVFFEEVTEWGTDYTGAVPIKDSSGNGIAVLAVDIDLSFLREIILRNALVNIFAIIGLGCIFVFYFLHWSRTNITRPIRQLEASAVKFAGRSHGQRSVEELNFEPPDLKRNNEIKSLSDAVVKMTDDIRNYVHDIINAEKKATNYEQLANRDSLTGVRNKNAYIKESASLEEQLQNGETKIGLAVVDLNFLKKINDEYGHAKGDLAIQKLCRCICEIFRHSPVYRIGGDEFVIVLRGDDYDHYSDLEARFCERIEAMDKDETLEPWEKISGAMGAAFYDPSLDEGMDSVFKRADQMMYERKKEMKAVRTV